MHRITRVVNRGKVDVHARYGWLDSNLRDVVHEAVTTTLLEEQENS